MRVCMRLDNIATR